MKIEDIEELEERWKNADSSLDVYSLLEEAIEALRLEAWHPIEKAEELGAKDGNYVLLVGGNSWFEQPFYKGRFYLNIWKAANNGSKCEPTHFRFINLP